MTDFDRFSQYVLRAVDKIAQERKGGGYDLNSYFTRNLDYGHTGIVPANHPPKTMCVAAVCEVIIEALNIYAVESNDYTPFQKLPLKSWKGGTRSDIRAHIFMYDGVGSRGTAHALSRFGIGGELAFERLKPGDFINLNRKNGTGHAVVFLSYINDHYGEEADYSPAVAGFKYFSAQGKGLSDAGFAFRWAFFHPNCPVQPADKHRDCGIIRSSDFQLLDSGYLLHPRAWDVGTAIAQMKSEHMGDVQIAFAEELQPSDLSRFSDQMSA